jgi:hypothetical protein
MRQINISDVRVGHSHLRTEQSSICFPQPAANLPPHVHLYECKLLQILRVHLVEVGGSKEASTLHRLLFRETPAGTAPANLPLSKLHTDQSPELCGKDNAALWAAAINIKIRLTKSAHGQTQADRIPLRIGRPE